jgi:hypothetical protein
LGGGDDGNERSKPVEWRADWAMRKCELALNLSRGDCGGSYGDGVMILCAAISALAAEAWPGSGRDKKRFVEALVKHARISHPEFISVPLLISGAGHQQQHALRSTFIAPLEHGIPSTILSGNEVDKPEQDIFSVCLGLGLHKIRRYSYANLLYEEIRCGYSHEYDPGEKARSWSVGARVADTPTTYVNMLSDCDQRTRLIHFHIEWIADVVTEIACSLDKQAQMLPLSEPEKWWIDG